MQCALAVLVYKQRQRPRVLPYLGNLGNLASYEYARTVKSNSSHSQRRRAAVRRTSTMVLVVRVQLYSCT
jgi:hypothetical protein